LETGNGMKSPKGINFKCAGHVVYLTGAGQTASSPERAVMAGIS
jgi:hypothetical protein